MFSGLFGSKKKKESTKENEDVKKIKIENNKNEYAKIDTKDVDSD